VEALGLDAIHQELSKYRYCTVFHVEGEALDAASLEVELERIGDSLLVVGDPSALKVHLHTDEPGAALSLATAVGVVEGVEVANMHVQAEQREERLLEGTPATLPALATLETGLVAVCPGQGNRRLFESLGATRVIEGGQSMNPSTTEILEAIEATPAEAVLVLPNNSNVILTAEQASELSQKAVRVIPSRSVQAGLAAMGRYIPTNSPDVNEAEMLDALASVSTGEVTVASRDAQLDGVKIAKGEYLGLVGDEAVAAGDDIADVTRAVVERVLAGERGWLGILTGEGAPPVEELLADVGRTHPGVDVEVHEGGQPHYPLLLVAE
jgi:dihydroxyacetone kinase-like predicted kinase